MSETTGPKTITIEKKGHAIIACPNVKLLDEGEMKTLGQYADEAASAEGISLVVFDMSHVRIVPSLTLGLLVQISQKCKSRRMKLKLAAMQPQVRQIFAMTRLDRVLDLATTVDAALE